MQVNTSYASSATSALHGMYGSQNMDEMDSKLSSEIMKAKDADSSGSLSTSELGVSSSQLSEFDTDGDGQISAAELTAGLKAQREKMQAQMQTQMQQSGQMGMLQASMGQQPDESQMATKIAQDVIGDKDTNKDGVLSADELGVSAEQLKKVDTDGDGSVTESELSAALKSDHEKKMAQSGGQMGPPPDGTSGAQGTSGKPSTDELIAGLFSDSESTSSTTASSDSSASSSSSLAAELMKKQKASSAYLNMDRLISDLFGGSDDTSQAVSASA